MVVNERHLNHEEPVSFKQPVTIENIAGMENSISESQVENPNVYMADKNKLHMTLPNE